MGASYSDVPAVVLPQTGGGTARFDDASVTTATAEDVTAGKVFLSSNGTITTGTRSGGGDVTSVNGQTGDVVLDAADVGALPDTTVIPTKTSDLTNDSGYMTGMTILSYGHSTWNDFLTAYTANHVVYCRASSGSDPGSGSQTRMAFMAYVSDATNPTSVEFQYYRSVNTHSATQQGDQTYVYKLDKTAGWTVTVRENYTKIVAGTNMAQSYSNGTLTLNFNGTIPTKTSDLTNDSGFVNASGAASAAPVQSVNGQTGAVTLSIPSTASDVGAIAAPSSPTLGDVLTYNGSAWVAQALQGGGVFATPQQYGAVGDGVADDSDAINNCLHANQSVYIPEGLYRVTKTIDLHIVMRNTVFCSDKAMIIADATAFNDAISSATSVGERPSVLKMSSYVGWNQFGATWFGGVINCNNVEGLIGVSINQYSGAFAYVPKMFVTGIGDDGVGVYISNSSSKIRFDQLLITGATVTVGETGNWTLTRNLEKTTIGLYNDSAYDYSIGTLDINSCTVGVYSPGGDDVFCEHYHYWVGADSDNISYTQYLKTRAFSGTSGWTFGYFYNDQAYIGAECNSIICQKVKQNTAPVSSITNVPSGTTVMAYLLYPKSSWGHYGVYNITAYANTIPFGGVLHDTVTLYSTWRMNAIKFSIASEAASEYGHTYFGIYNGNYMRFGNSITADTWYVIGYIPKTMPGQVFLRFNHTQLVGECTINIYNGNAYITDAKKVYSNGTWKVAIGSTAMTVQSDALYPIVLKHSANRGWTAWNIQADGTSPIMAPKDVSTVYTGSVTGEVEFTA